MKPTKQLHTAATEALRWFEAPGDEKHVAEVVRLLREALGKPVQPYFFDARGEYLETAWGPTGDWMAAFSEREAVRFYRGRGEEQWHALLRLHSPLGGEFVLYSRQLSLRDRAELAHHFGSRRGPPRGWGWALLQALRVADFQPPPADEHR